MAFFSSSKVQNGSQPASSSEPLLPLDCYQKEGMIIILAPVAGISIEDIEITLHNEVLMIRGIRKKPEDLKEKDYSIKECYWGPFERSVILPVKTELGLFSKADPKKIAAFYKRGMLRIDIPIQKNENVF